jgi:hypothetical protein
MTIIFSFKAITTSRDENLQHLKREVVIVLASQSQLSCILLERLRQLDDVLSLVMTWEPSLNPLLEPVVFFHRRRYN